MFRPFLVETIGAVLKNRKAMIEQTQTSTGPKMIPVWHRKPYQYYTGKEETGLPLLFQSLLYREYGVKFNYCCSLGETNQLRRLQIYLIPM